MTARILSLLFFTALALAFLCAKSGPGPLSMADERLLLVRTVPVGGDAVHFKLRPGPEANRLLASLDARLERLQCSSIRPLFERESVPPALAGWRRVALPVDRPVLAEALAHHLLALLDDDPRVECAFVTPAMEPASFRTGRPVPSPTARPANAFCPIHTPSYDLMQGYAGPAPEGIDAVHAGSLPGGRGSGLWFADVEGGWNVRHEDVPGERMQHVAGIPIGERGWLAHGTAVVGVVASRENGKGMTGLVPDIERIFTGSIGGIGVAPALERTASQLRAGDVLLIELHGPGPRSKPGSGPKGFVPVEWWQDCFDVIRQATARGVVVVEAAGNGGEDLDDAIYGRRFDRRVRDSGAILVGAGAPPCDGFVDRSRLWFSNHGSRVDLQGWGLQVATLDYGDLQGCSETSRMYTAQFSGTSSASPVVAGAVLALQGIHRARTGQVLTGAELFGILDRTGTTQTDGPYGPATQRIGPRPDLKRAIALLPLPR